MMSKETRQQLKPYSRRETIEYYANGIVPERFAATDEQRRREAIAIYSTTVPTGTGRTGRYEN